MRDKGDETILAVSSAPGSGAAAVLRLSGPATIPRLASLARHEGAALGSAPGSSVVPVTLDLNGFHLRVRVGLFRAPRSYTREDLAEITVPGSPPIIALVSRAILAAAPPGEGNIRWARPGELTLRAFLNGRLDLSQAESVAGLIGATGEAEARASQRGLRGELGSQILGLHEGVLEVLALLEAALDFPDEDLPQVAPSGLTDRIEKALEGIRGLRRSSAIRVASDGSLRVVLAGFPNAGKSSLLNALLGRSAAISSDAPGTTRDPVRGVTAHGGKRIEWIDVAGSFDGELRVLGGERVEETPIWNVVRRLTRVELERADCVLWVADPLGRFEDSLAEFRRLEARSKLLVIQKIDLLSLEERDRLSGIEEGPQLVSARQRLGLDALVRRVTGVSRAHRGEPPLEGPQFLLSAYQEVQLAAVAEALARARAGLERGAGYELAASDLRDALGGIHALLAARPGEAVLDLLFSRFCIGK